MAEPPPPPLPPRMPLLPLPLPQRMPLLPQPPPTPKISVAAAGTRRPMAAPPTAPLHQAQPPPPPVAALPQPRPPPPPVAVLRQPQPPPPPVAAPSSPRDHVAQNPRIGDSGDVESGSGMSTVEALQEITLYVGALSSAPMALQEEECVADERDSTSLSDICARMIQSCTYTVEVKVCGGGTANCEDSTFSWDIVEGSSSSLKDLLASIAGTFPLFSGESIRSKAISVAPDSPAMGTRSKKSVSPNSPAMSTRSKKRVVPNSQVMATRSKNKLKL